MRATQIATSFVAPDVIELRLDLGEVRHARWRDAPPERIDTAGIDPRIGGWVWDDAWIGRVTPGGGWMGLDRYVASPLDGFFALRGAPGERSARADDPGRWTVTVDGEEVGIARLSRKADIREDATTGWGVHDYATTQTVYLELDAPLSRGQSVEIDAGHRRWETVEATYDPRAVISEAVHVNLLGFAPGDGVKAGWLSSWQGRVADGGPEGGEMAAQAWDAPPRWALIDEETGRAVARGRATLELAEDDASTPRTGENFVGAELWRMDFSDVDTPGTYHLRVAGTGRSQSFEIAEDHWQDVFETSFSGFYHQRSGIALTAEHTDWTRDRALHPADGKVTVLATDVRIGDANQGFSDAQPVAFDLFPDAVTGEVLPRAWGGWHDAGDTDRRTQHLEAVRKLLELNEIAPEWSRSLDASIPEGGGRLPDLVDEALWGLRFFARLQTDEGGVRGGVESPAYTGHGSVSWDEAGTLYAYAPDAWTSWEFAAAAAKMSYALEDLAPKQAARWLRKAEAAWDWAEAEYEGGLDAILTIEAGGAEDAARILNASRNVAAVELYRATGERDYHRTFLDTFEFRRGPEADHWLDWQFEAAFAYARIDEAPTRARVVRNAEKAILQEARAWMEETDLGFGASGPPWSPYGWENTNQSVDAAETLLVRAHVLTGRDRFLDAAQGDMQYLLGANPGNQVYMTGFDGVRTPASILHGDGEAMGGRWPPGITLYGDHDASEYSAGEEWYYGLMQDDVWPTLFDRPNYETFQSLFDYVAATEFTVQQGIMMSTYVAGYLAAEAAGLDGL